jgi:aryl sulfotransferase
MESDMESDTVLAHYVNEREDSARWSEVALRPGDIVVSTPPKAGTTWIQTICALLITQDPALPAPLDDLSPWLDMKMVPIEAVRTRLDRQTSRRIIKTHTPLDGLPLRDDVTYLVGARHPLDVALSTYHQWRNLDLDVIRAALGVTTAEMPDPEPVDARTWISAWIREEVEDLHSEPHSLQNLMWHLSDAWSRRTTPNVTLIHYADLSTDLPGTMRALAARLDISVPDGLWPILVEAATFTRMRERADDLAPRVIPFRSRTAFFREGRSGGGAELVTEADLAIFHHRVGVLAPADLGEWLLR